MTRDLLHDYLDGRMDPERRSAFEERLRKEPDLARELETWRALGATLREQPDLPPGFYARARSRFERTRRPGLRIWSWQTAGLAAAVMLIAVAFLPALWRDRLPAPEQSMAKRADAPAREVLADSLQPAAPDTDAPAESRPVAQQAPAGDVETGARLKEAPEEPDPGRPAAGGGPGDEREKAGTGRQVAAGALKPEAVPAPVQPRGQKKAEATEGDDAGLALKRAAAPSTIIPESYALTPGAVEPGKLEPATIDGPWRKQILGLASSAFGERQRRRDSADRENVEKQVWLVGLRPGLPACMALVVEVTEEAYVLRLGPPDLERGGGLDGGCAVVLPDDGRLFLVLESE